MNVKESEMKQCCSQNCVAERALSQFKNLDLVKRREKILELENVLYKVDRVMHTVIFLGTFPGISKYVCSTAFCFAFSAKSPKDFFSKYISHQSLESQVKDRIRQSLCTERKSPVHLHKDLTSGREIPRIGFSRFESLYKTAWREEWGEELTTYISNVISVKEYKNRNYVLVEFRNKKFDPCWVSMTYAMAHGRDAVREFRVDKMSLYFILLET